MTKQKGGQNELAGTEKIAPFRQWHLLLLFLSPVLLWPALVNGGAFYFPDTTAYIRGVDAALNHAVGWRSAWTEPTPMPATTTPVIVPTTIEADSAKAPADAKPVLLGRSVFYGILPFFSVVSGSDWTTIIIQALITGVVLIGFTRHFFDPQDRDFILVCVVCFAAIAATSLPFFVSMLMPDFMTGLSLLAAAVLIVGNKHESRSWIFTWFMLITAAALMHSSNVLILLVVGMSAIVVASLKRDSTTAYGGAFVVGGALLGLVGELAFATGVTRIMGVAPIRPPFVTARLIEDGPGLSYLDRSCPTSGFLLCKFRGRMPAPSDSFLWSASPVDGVFSASPPLVRRALSEEQSRFVAAVVKTFPLEVANSSIRAVGRQITQLGLEEFNYPPRNHLDRVPVSVVQDIASTRAYKRMMPVSTIEMLLWPTMLASIAIVLAALTVPATRRSAWYGAVIMLGWFANNVACGALSTPHERYQARVMWVLPLIATLIVAQAWRGRRRRPA